MNTEKKGKPDEDLLREMGYEHGDLAMPKIGKAVAIFFGFTLFCYAIAWAFMKLPIFPQYFTAKPQTAAPDRVLPQPPNPLLQSNTGAKIDIAKLRKAETEALTSFGKSKYYEGYYRMPIDKAIELVAERGLTPTGKSVPAVTKGNTIAVNTTRQPDGQPVDVQMRPGGANP